MAKFNVKLFPVFPSYTKSWKNQTDLAFHASTDADQAATRQRMLKSDAIAKLICRTDTDAWRKRQRSKTLLMATTNAP
jgi:hypothetical protein